MCELYVVCGIVNSVDFVIVDIVQFVVNFDVMFVVIDVSGFQVQFVDVDFVFCSNKQMGFNNIIIVGFYGYVIVGGNCFDFCSFKDGDVLIFQGLNNDGGGIWIIMVQCFCFFDDGYIIVKVMMGLCYFYVDWFVVDNDQVFGFVL